MEGGALKEESAGKEGRRCVEPEESQESVSEGLGVIMSGNA